MKTRKDQIIRLAFFLLSCAVLIFCSVRTLQRKEAFFLDEYSSYSCANSADGKPIPVKSGEIYSSEELLDMALDHYSVRENERFRFDIVWNNLDSNVHPPVFYAALHLVCSLTPGQFSIWQAGAVNIFFALVGLFFFHQLARAISGSEWLGGILCLLWSMNMGLISSIVLLRDYTAAMCGCTMTLWEVYRFWKGHQKITDLIKLGLAFALSVLSHYYSAIYLFFLCALLCVFLMAKKDWKSIVKVILTAGGSAVLSIIIFPSLVTRIFASNRGTEATGNLLDSNFSSYFESIRKFYNSFNSRVFAGRISYLFLLGLLLLLVSILLRKRHALESKNDFLSIPLSDVCLLVIPTIFFFLLVAKLAPMQAARYLYHVYPVFYLSVFTSFLYVAQHLPKQRIFAAGICVVMLLASLFSWNTGKFNYLYIGQTQRIERKLAAYKGADAIQISENHGNMICVTLPEYAYFNTITYYENNRTSKDVILNHPALTEGRDVVLLLFANDSSVENLALIQEAYPQYQVEELGYIVNQHRFLQYYLHQ